MNPYFWYEHLYVPEAQVYYANKLVWDEISRHFDEEEMNPKMPENLSPHVYETASLAYKGMALFGKAQSILVSGESGAGKTETVKICMHHIATLQRGPPENREAETTVVERVLDSNPILESFGNAKTRRNDNSSRFGRYTQLQFDVIGTASRASASKAQSSPARLAGSTCEVYLLEKNRVVKHTPADERTFHIFYELLAAPEQEKVRIWKGLKGAGQHTFSYIGRNNTTHIEGVSDHERFSQTVEALEVVGISGTLLVELFRSLCVVLQLGNIVYAPDPQDPDKSIITSEKELERLSSVMGIQKDHLRQALVERTISTRDETYKVPLAAAAAKESCDGLAKDIYEKVFLWLVRTINLATCAEENYDAHNGRKSEDYGIIGLLDIFGFEAFHTNRFEQLCINYANEKLQAKFTEDCFKMVALEYKEEGIPLEHITFNDNTDVLNLIEGRSGLLATLNEECWRPQGNARAFVGKALQQNKDSPCLIVEKLDVMKFGIHHYAGKVSYSSNDFVTRNQDRLPSDLKECAAVTTNTIIRGEYSSDADDEANGKGRSSGSAIMATTVWTKYKSQLLKLMEDLGKTESRYIRTIKPNSIKEPLLVEHELTITQLRSCGIVASVTISRSAFPNKLPNKTVVSRFGGIVHQNDHAASRTSVRGGTPEEQMSKDAEALMSLALKHQKFVDPNTGKAAPTFIVGKTKTFFREGILELLEADRLNGLDVQAAIIQRHFREFRKNKSHLFALRMLRRKQMEHQKMAQARQEKKEAEKKAKEEEARKEALDFEERMLAERRVFDERMAEEDRKFEEQLKLEEDKRHAQMEAEHKVWEENMAKQEAEWKIKAEEEAKHRKALDDELESHRAEVRALKKQLQDQEEEAENKLMSIEGAILESKKQRREYDRKIDNLDGAAGALKREFLFADAILKERDRLIKQLERENKRLVKLHDRVEEKYDAINLENQELQRDFDNKNKRCEKRESLNMSVTNTIGSLQEEYEKVKEENGILQDMAAKQIEAYSIMTQARMEAQHAMTAITEIIRDDGGKNLKDFKKTISRMNLDLTKESYHKLRDVQKQQEEAKKEMVDFSISDLHQSWIVH